MDSYSPAQMNISDFVTAFVEKAKSNAWKVWGGLAGAVVGLLTARVQRDKAKVTREQERDKLISNMIDRITTVEGRADVKDKEIANLTTLLNEKVEEIEDNKKHIAELLDAKSALQKSYAELLTKHDGLKAQHDSLQDQNGDQQQQLNTYGQRIEDLESQLAASKNEGERLQKELIHVIGERNDAQQVAALLRAKITELQQEYLQK